MKINLKKITMTIMVSVLLVGGIMVTSQPSFAEMQKGEVQVGTYIAEPRWTGLNSVLTQMIENPQGYATPTYTILYFNTKIDKIRIYTQLQLYKNGRWTNVQSWDRTLSATTGALSHDEKYKVTESGDYRFTYTIDAKKGNTIVDTTSGTSQSENI